MKSLRIVSWNVNGLRAVHKKGFVDWFQREKPDMLCIQEIKASLDQVPADIGNIEGYHAHFSYGERKGYSGVGLLTREEPTRVTTSLGMERFDVEGRLIAADYGGFLLLNVYFPNGKASEERLHYKMDFYAAFLDYANGLRKRGKGLIVCCDLNTAHKEIDLARPKENEKVSGFLPEERAWIDGFLSHGFTDTFRMFNNEGDNYSWWDLKTRARERNVGWRIDYCFVSDDLRPNVRSAFICSDVMGSDHCPIGVELAWEPSASAQQCKVVHAKGDVA